MKSLIKLAILCCLSLALPALAQAPATSAEESARRGVEMLLNQVSESKSYFMSDRDRYFTDVQTVLDTFVDFREVALVVMSRYRDSATEPQIQRFADILKNTLTRFYGASLVSYNGEELVFLPPANPPSDPRADTVVGMELRGDTVFKLQYQMFVNANDEWKLKNMSLAGINLGRQYFTQFSAAMAENDNDIDQVLDNWN